FVTSHSPPLSTASVTLTPVMSAAPGFETVIVPATVHSESVPASCVTSTVYLNVASPPGVVRTSVLSTDFSICHVNVRLRLGYALLVTSSSLGLQPSPQKGFVFPKSGALISSPGLTTTEITPLATVMPSVPSASSAGAVRFQSGPNVPSLKTTVWVEVSSAKPE